MNLAKRFLVVLGSVVSLIVLYFVVGISVLMGDGKIDS